MSSASIPSLEIRGSAARLPRLDSSNGILFVLLALALVRGLLYAVLSPPFDGPDESAHLQYVAYLATNGRAGPIGPEGHQPVGYYALMVPAYWLTVGQPADIQLLAVRIASIPFLLGMVLFTWLAARKMSPGSAFVPVVAAGFVALQPALAYIGASANNDNAANLMGAILTYLVVLLLSGKPRRWVAPVTAVAVGVAILTKGQILPIVAISAAVLTVRIVTGAHQLGWTKLLLYVAAPVLVAAALLARRAGERMLEMSTTSASMLVNWSAAWHMVQQSNPQETFRVQFITFWTAYLAGTVHPAAAWYYALGAVILLAAIGYALRLAGRGAPPHRSAVLLRVALLGMLLGVWLAAYLLFLYMFQDPSFPWRMAVIQGRYLHVAIAPLALLVGEGWSLLALSRIRAAAGWGILTLMAAFDVASLAVLVGHYAWR